MSEREAVAWLFGYNLSIILAIVAVTLGGLLLTGEWHGLWSMVLGLAMKSELKTKKSGGTD